MSTPCEICQNSVPAAEWVNHITGKKHKRLLGSRDKLQNGTNCKKLKSTQDKLQNEKNSTKLKSTQDKLHNGKNCKKLKGTKAILQEGKHSMKLQSTQDKLQKRKCHKRLCYRQKHRVEQRSKRTVHVDGFLQGTLESDLHNYFSPLAKVSRVMLKKNKECSALVEFELEEEATLVKNQQHVFYGRTLGVLPATKKCIKKYDRQKSIRFNQFSQTIPWERISEAVDMDEQIRSLPGMLGLDGDDHVIREQLCSSLEKVFTKFWPDSQLSVFGSSTNGLGAKNCDLDLFLDVSESKQTVNNTSPSLTSNCGNVKSAWKKLLLSGDFTGLSPEEMCRTIARMVKEYVPKSVDVIAITKARCPIVKFVHSPTGISVDISTKNKLGVYNTSLIQLLHAIDPRVRPLIFTLRFWARECYLSGSGSTQNPNNYALTMLGLFYLQNTTPPVLPCVQFLVQRAARSVKISGWECGFLNDINKISPSLNTQSCAELLDGFFEFYNDFNFEERVICPYSGFSLPKVELLEMKNTIPAMAGFNIMPLCVQDPFILSNNIASNVTETSLANLRLGFIRAKAITGSIYWNSREWGAQPWGLGALCNPGVSSTDTVIAGEDRLVISTSSTDAERRKRPAESNISLSNKRTKRSTSAGSSVNPPIEMKLSPIRESNVNPPIQVIDLT